eukprot:scaffold12632_cov90-Isochrysis_galbana.AAC.1
MYGSSRLRRRPRQSVAHLVGDAAAILGPGRLDAILGTGRLDAIPGIGRLAAILGTDRLQRQLVLRLLHRLRLRPSPHRVGVHGRPRRGRPNLGAAVGPLAAGARAPPAVRAAPAAPAASHSTPSRPSRCLPHPSAYFWTRCGPLRAAHRAPGAAAARRAAPVARADLPTPGPHLAQQQSPSHQPRGPSHRPASLGPPAGSCGRAAEPRRAQPVHDPRRLQPALQDRNPGSQPAPQPARRFGLVTPPPRPWRRGQSAAAVSQTPAHRAPERREQPMRPVNWRRLAVPRPSRPPGRAIRGPGPSRAPPASHPRPRRRPAGAANEALRCGVLFLPARVAQQPSQAPKRAP